MTKTKIVVGKQLKKQIKTKERKDFKKDFFELLRRAAQPIKK